MTPLVSAAKALSDPNRVRILAMLRDGELCVCELCDALRLTQSTLSTHLQVIRKAELVTTRKLGKWNYYAIAPSAKWLLNSLFGFFADSLASDRKLAVDARRLKSRLALREEGACCVGFACGTSTRKETTR